MGAKAQVPEIELPAQPTALEPIVEARGVPSVRAPATPAPPDKGSSPGAHGSVEPVSSSLYARLKKRCSPLTGGSAKAHTPGAALVKTPGSGLVRTPAARPAGEMGIANWLENAGLGRVHGLIEALLTVAKDLDSLRDVEQSRFDHAIGPLKLKPKGIKYKKLQSALGVLKGEVAAFVPNLGATEPEWVDGKLERPLLAPLDHDTSVTRVTIADMPAPKLPKIGDLRMPANPNRPRAKSRTALPAAGEEQGGAGVVGLKMTAAHKAGMYKAASEAKELEDLASLFGNDGDKVSRRVEHAGVVTRARAAAAHVHQEIVKRTTTPTSSAKPFDLMGDFAATERNGGRTKPSGSVGGGDGGGALAGAFDDAGGGGETEGERIAAAIKRDLAAEAEKREAMISFAPAADGGEDSVRGGKKGKGKKGGKKGKKSGASTARGAKKDKENEVPQMKKRSQSFPLKVGGKRKLLTEDAVCAGERRVLGSHEDAVCAGERRVLDRDELKCAGDKKQRLIDEETQCAGERKLVDPEDRVTAGTRHVVNPDDRATAGGRPKARFAEDTQVSGDQRPPQTSAP